MAVGMLKEMALRWFTETQAALILQNGRLPEWFHGFVTRKEAESVLRDRDIGHFLIRLSDRAIGYILSYKGADRCRHFVIQQLKNGRYMIDGSIHTHKSLTALIAYYMTEVIQPFGEVLTESCSQDERSSLYDHISFNLPHNPCSEEAESKEPAARRPGGHPQSEEVPRRPPAIPPKKNRILTARRMNSSLESMSSNSEGLDIAPPLPVRTSLVFEEESQEGVIYGRVHKFKSNKKPLPAASGEDCRIKDSSKNPFHSAEANGRKSQPAGQPPYPSVETNGGIYSLAMEPQPIYSDVFEPTHWPSDVVYTEVDLKQRKMGTVPTGSGNNYATIAVPTEQSCQPVEGKHLNLATPPSTPPRLSPNLNHRVKSSSPTHSSQKREASRKLSPTLRPLPQPADFNERTQIKDSSYE
ncbi:hypothetical protein scyTo_0011143, partial [Scyliorhinus torazame]|nr:hypothetical protein [Scyliorhinus torazame]